MFINVINVGYFSVEITVHFSIANLEFVVYNDIAHIKTMVNFPTPVVWVYKNRESGKMKTQGIGNHSVEEVRQMADEQLGVLSTLLGKYLSNRWQMSSWVSYPHS